MTDIQEIAQAASRAYEDPRFAQEILDGKHDYPQVRDAILGDLSAAYPDAAEPAATASAEPQDSLRDAMRTGQMNVARLAERARAW